MAPHRRGRYAFVICLWGSSKDYVLGALVLGYSIKRTKTQNTLVCLHADDVPPEYVELLQLFWECRVVDHIEVKAARRLSTDDYIEESRFFKVFTKLRALEQTDFEKVLVMDIDLLVLSNIDDLFQFPAPAGMKRGMNKGRWPYKHGDDIDGNTFFGGRNPGSAHSWGQGTGINAGVMLLEPNAAEFQIMQEELLEPYHPAHVRGNGPEQDYLSRFWADRPWRHISVEYNYQIHHLYNALHPMLGDVERLKVAQNCKSIRVIHYSGDSEVKPWTRCLEKSYGWPSREQDEEYMKEFLSAYHSYLLWVEKDRERWTKMERNMFEDSGIKGFSLGEDGVIYYQEEEGSEKVPKETSSEAIQTAFEATRFFLCSWFDTLEAANRSVGFDLCERLKSAAQSEAPAKGSSTQDPWADADPWSQGRVNAPSLQRERSAQSQGKSSAPAASTGKSKDETPVTVDKAWAEYVPPVRSSAEHYRHSRPLNGHKQPSGQRKDRNDIDSEKEIAVTSCAETGNHFVNFLGPPEIRKFFMPEYPGEDLSGLYARDEGRVREFAPKTEGDLDAFETWVSSIERGEVVLIAGIKLNEAVMQKVLSCLERLGAMHRQVPEGAAALAVVGFAGRGGWKIRFDPVCASASVLVRAASNSTG